MSNEEFVETLVELDACDEAIRRVRRTGLGPNKAWRACTEPAWLTWLWVRVNEPTIENVRALMRVLADIVGKVIPIEIVPDEGRVIFDHWIIQRKVWPADFEESSISGSWEHEGQDDRIMAALENLDVGLDEFQYLRADDLSEISVYDFYALGNVLHPLYHSDRSVWSGSSPFPRRKWACDHIRKHLSIPDDENRGER